MSARVFIENGRIDDRALPGGPYAIIREERTGWQVVAIVFDREVAEQIVSKCGGALPYVGLGDRQEKGPIFLRSCIVEADS